MWRKQCTATVLVIGAAAAVALTLGVLPVTAQTGQQVKKAGEQITQAEEQFKKAMEVREVTLTGRVVDLHCYMTGQFVSEDHTKCTAECIRSGVPALLDTATGPVFLGQGMKGTARLLEPLAFQEVEIRGKLYNKKGLKYLDITEATKLASAQWDRDEGDE